MTAPPATAAPRAATAPLKIRIEVSSYCQLRCPSCPTTTRAIDPHVGRGFLTTQNLERLLRDNPQLREIELSNYGEAFINPELPELLRLAHAHGVATTLQNGANLNDARPEALEAVVRYGMQAINCSIDGATQDTYARYRVRGDLAAVLRNVDSINQWKRELKSKRPQLFWQMVLFEHNKHEVMQAVRMARQRDMTFILKLSWDDGLAPFELGPELAKHVKPNVARRGDWEAKAGVPYMEGLCLQLWDGPQINWDGKVLGCCRNFWGDFGGNAFRDGLGPALAHEKLTYAKAMLKGEAPPRADIPCTTCELYEKRRAMGRWVTDRV